MLVTLLLALQAASVAPANLEGAGPPTQTVYSGRASALTVKIPRIENEVIIDGALDEAVWGSAAMLNGFSQFSPSDGVAASDSTQVLVWYSPTAVYFGIRAFEAHGQVHATLANRDKIFADDNVQILLGTFNDGRQATVFALNPFGIQADGALVETGKTAGGFTGGTLSREPTDLSPDFTFQSKGRLTDFGYEIEVRIPFKSLRYQAQDVQTWQLNVVRETQHSGYEDSWTPAHRASASFLGQSGTLVGLNGLHRGLVLDVNPELTGKLDGAPTGSGWKYKSTGPDIGGNVRWGVTNNLTLNGTAKPDFSQVESDAGQLAFDPRQALFFAEKRPFFLEGIELFSSPTNLIYTRRIVQPVAAVKLTGKGLGVNAGLLSAVDDRAASATGSDNPVYNILRVQKDVGPQSRLGVVYTDRIDGNDYNRVGALDGRLVFGGVYSAQFQVAGSLTRSNSLTTPLSPLWLAKFNRNGKAFGFRTSFTGIADQFRAGSGFISRPGIVDLVVNPSYTLYGKRGSLIESFTGDIALDGTWQYQHFVHSRNIQDQKLHFNGNASLHGGWAVGTGLFIESFGYDSALYAGYALERPAAGGGLDTVRFTGQPTIPNFEGYVQVVTPQFAKFDGSIFALYGHDENFFEWASSKLLIGTAAFNWRPTDKLRAELSYNWQLVLRRSDGSKVGEGRIPRLKLEYQIARPLFVRLVGQYDAEQVAALRDDGRTNAPILILQNGTYVRTTAQQSNSFRGDVLVSYQPTPGTVLFAGYGSTLDEPKALHFSGLRRQVDGFFLKVSYLYRL
ncbi:MAG: DUF5916 domain-containing protein [Gemmatimonadota bacterium]